MAFSKWKDIPEVQEPVEKLKNLSKKYFQLLEAGGNDNRTQAQKIWSTMSASYWEILFAIVDANTKDIPEQLTFDDEEKLFIDLGCMPGVLSLNKDFDLEKYFAAKCAPDIFPVMTFSDYIAEAWAMITGNPAPAPSIGMTLSERIDGLNNLLSDVQGERNEFLRKLAAEYPSKISINQTIETMSEALIPAMKVIMRVPEYREGDENFRQQLAQQRKAYLDSENTAMLLVSSAQKNEANPLPLAQYEKFMELQHKTRILAKKILYTQIDETKIARNAQKITDACAEMSPQMRRSELKNMLMKKREYIAVPAKNARCDTSLLCQPDSMPIDYAEDYEIFSDFNSSDMDMFNVPRVRMYGLPRVIFIPGKGLGTYDWADHTLLVPSFSIDNNEEQSVAYALGTFRWDSDEDHKVRGAYERIKENKKKSLLALSASFYKDYSIWMTKERKGYRLLPRETHKVFLHMCAPKLEN